MSGRYHTRRFQRILNDIPTKLTGPSDSFLCQDSNIGSRQSISLSSSAFKCDATRVGVRGTLRLPKDDIED